MVDRYNKLLILKNQLNMLFRKKSGRHAGRPLHIICAFLQLYGYHRSSENSIKALKARH